MVELILAEMLYKRSVFTQTKVQFVDYFLQLEVPINLRFIIDAQLVGISI